MQTSQDRTARRTIEELGLSDIDKKSNIKDVLGCYGNPENPDHSCPPKRGAGAGVGIGMLRGGKDSFN